ncbi:MAG: NAD(P)H-dependent oxidoreductase [Deltaproteobacteria bacterium]|nr:NAD(P)H-dependent oxidoreductase [Deltaproteobacteria bacterium]
MIVGVCASGRRDGNSARLLAEALAGAAEVSSERQTRFELAQLSFRGCLGCGTCRAESETCITRDELTPALDATATAGALALAAPIYYGYPSGLFKSYLDRWYCFKRADRTLRVREGRPALLILTQAASDPNAYAWTAQSLEKVLAGYGFRPSILVAAGVHACGDAGARPELLAEVRRLGSALAAATPSASSSGVR